MEGGADSWLLLVYGRLMSEDRGKRGGEGLSCVGCVGSGRLEGRMKMTGSGAAGNEEKNLMRGERRLLGWLG